MLTQQDLIADFGMKLATYLDDNERVKKFCQDNFQKEPKIYVGEFLRRTIPTSKDCPYIIITELVKREGTRSAVDGYVQYYATLYVGVSSEKGAMDAGKISIYTGNRLLSEFMEIIEEELNARNYSDRPLDQVEARIMGAIEPDGSHWGGTMECRWKFQQTLNTPYMEKF